MCVQRRSLTANQSVPTSEVPVFQSSTLTCLVGFYHCSFISFFVSYLIWTLSPLLDSLFILGMSYSGLGKTYSLRVRTPSPSTILRTLLYFPILSQPFAYLGCGYYTSHLALTYVLALGHVVLGCGLLSSYHFRTPLYMTCPGTVYYSASYHRVPHGSNVAISLFPFFRAQRASVELS